MALRHVIVDGSNLATEGRSMPSLAQLDQAVREFIAENPTDEVTVVVDASFGHRIDPSEVAAFEAAEEAGEVVSPPAGAIGRGDAFLLRIAEKTGATVLSNDSFQEFHGEHTWLFDKGRLVGGKPVPGVGWIFMDRTPVRGAKSREVTKEAKRKKHSDGDGGAKAAEAKAPESRVRARPKAIDRAIARATEEVTEPKSAAKRRRRSVSPPSDPVNEPLAFITFVAAHPLGSEVVGSVVEYSSHGAFVDADGLRCYVPLSAMGDPPPRRAREAVTKGEPVALVVQAFDPARRGVELALPGFARIAGRPTAETVEAEIGGEAAAAPPRRHGRRSAPSSTAAEPTPEPEPTSQPQPIPEPQPTPEPEPIPEPVAARRGRTRKVPAAQAAPAADSGPAPTAAGSVPSAAATAGPAAAGAPRSAAGKAKAATAPAKATAKATSASASPVDVPAKVAPAKVAKVAKATSGPASPAGATRAAKATEAPATVTRATKAAAKATSGPASPVKAAKAPAKATGATKATKAPVKAAGAAKATKAPVKAAGAAKAAVKATRATGEPASPAKATKAPAKAAKATKGPALPAEAPTGAPTASDSGGNRNGTQPEVPPVRRRRAPAREAPGGAGDAGESG